MNRLTRFSRLAAATALGSSLAAAPAAFAQTNAPPPPAAAAPAPAAPGPAIAPAPAAAPAAEPGAAPEAPGAGADTSATPAAADPPARAGRIARISGTVSFHGPGADHWEAATLNFPVTDGDALWTEPNGSAAMDVSGSRLTLAGGTELDVEKLDATTLALTAPQGEVYLRLANLAPNETYTLVTPRGTVSIAQAGRYEVAAGDQSSPTMVTVLEGQAQVSGEGLALSVQPGQTATITGDQTFEGSVGALKTDAFLALVENQAPPPSQAALPPAVQAMPGAEDLSQAGNWQPTPDYGTVWYPPVAAGWAPYRDGRWAYVAPWGWTWVDAASWGFAPFHYGRWVQVADRWAWAPVYGAPGWAAPAGIYVRPVYAPALVSFVGFGVGVGIGVGIGASVGWFPLGWGEPFHPWYGGSRGYFEGINRAYVRNVTVINNTHITINNYANRHAATVVPAGVMTGSRPVAGAAHAVTAQQLASMHPVTTSPVRPAATTAGVTPAVAHHLGLPAAPAGVGARGAAPGPAIGAGAGAHPGAHPGAHVATPGLHAPGGAHPAVSGTAATPHATGAPGPAITSHAPGSRSTPALRSATPTAHTTGTGTTHTPAVTGGTAHTPTPQPSHPTPQASHPTPQASHPTPQASHPTPQVIHPTPQVTHPTPQVHSAPTPQPHAMQQAHAPAPHARAAPQQHAPAPHSGGNCKPGQRC